MDVSGTRDLQSINQPLIGKTMLSPYDEAGYPLQVTDVNGQVKSFSYDGRTRITKIGNAADGSRVGWAQLYRAHRLMLVLSGSGLAL